MYVHACSWNSDQPSGMFLVQVDLPSGFVTVSSEDNLRKQFTASTFGLQMVEFSDKTISLYFDNVRFQHAYAYIIVDLQLCTINSGVLLS
jgi:hypothetical protein